MKKSETEGYDMGEPGGIRHGITDKAKTRAVAAYMINHNDQHLEKLAELVDGMDQTASKLLLDAIGSYEMGNTQLRQLLEYLDQG